MLDDVNKLIEKLLKKFGTLDPFKLAEYLDIEIKYVDFNRQPLGHFSTILGDKVILLDQSLQDSNHRYLVASHELSHGLSHSDLSSYYSTGDRQRGKIEHEANLFSAELLYYFYIELFERPPGCFNDLINAFEMPDKFRQFYE